MFKLRAKTNGRKDCTTAQILVEPTLTCDRSVFIFAWECSQQYAAELLIKKINEDIDQQLSRIRQEAYNCGYQEGRNHSRKRTDFYSTWDHNHVGY